MYNNLQKQIIENITENNNKF